MTLQEKIAKEIDAYVEGMRPKPSVRERAEISCATLSGIWLAARWMSKNDGALTSQQLEQAAKAEGVARGWFIDQL